MIATWIIECAFPTHKTQYSSSSEPESIYYSVQYLQRFVIELLKNIVNTRNIFQYIQDKYSS